MQKKLVQKEYLFSSFHPLFYFAQILYFIYFTADRKHFTQALLNIARTKKNLEPVSKFQLLFKMK